MINILPASEVRDKISSVIKKIDKNGEPIYITQYSKPKAVMVKFEDYNNLMKRLEDLEDILDMLESLKEPGRPFEEFLAEQKK